MPPEQQQQQGLPLGREIALEACEDLGPMRVIVDKVIGQGSFATVYLAHDGESGEKYAIKRVFQDRRYKNRELLILRGLKHPNCLKLLQFFITTTGGQGGAQHLNLVTPYYPETLAGIMRYYSGVQEYIPLMYVRCFTYQLCRALAYIHSQGIIHRDIKPQNVMLDMESGMLTLIDYGSSKYYKEGEASVSYICSRFYRAPELLLGSTIYGQAIDMWGVGCILAEMLLGHPLFCGESTVDVLCEVFGLLGTPTREEARAMGTPLAGLEGLPVLRPVAWRSVFLSHPPDDALDLVARLLRLRPDARLSARDALAHPFFDKLRTGTLPGGLKMPDLFSPVESESEPEQRQTRLK